MSEITHYAIRGGTHGRERLRILSRVLLASTSSLFDRLEIGPGMTCLDVGCGGGDVTLELARRVGPHGRVVGVDIDAGKLELARAEAAARPVGNVEYRAIDIRSESAGEGYDLVYARFLLSHLAEPERVVAALAAHLRPGGRVIVEDVDFDGYFVWPESPAFDRFLELYRAVVRGRGGDPEIGPRLPSMLLDAGFADVAMSVSQPMGLRGDVKLINPLTMENIADAVVADGHATREETDRVVRELHDYAEDPTTLAGVVRVIQTWGRKNVLS